MRRCDQELTAIRTALTGLQEEMKATVELLRKHQSRIMAQDLRITAQDNRIELLDQKIWGIFNGRVWKSLELIGRLPRKVFKRS